MMTRGRILHFLLLCLASYGLFSAYKSLWKLVSGQTIINVREIIYNQMNSEDSLEPAPLFPRSSPSARDPAPFVADSAHQLLILSYQRCGSSFFGDIFGRHPAGIYYYEPLDGVYISLYGTKEGWNVPSDITNYSNGSERLPPLHEVTAVTDTLHNLLNCQVDALPNEVLLHKFWKIFSAEHQSLRGYQGCFEHDGEINSCRNHLTRLCSQRFIGDANPIEINCMNQMKSPNSTEFKTYKQCIDDVHAGMSRCIDKQFRKKCETKSFRVVKTVRATMASVEKLVKQNPNLRVIHLIRDPRAVVLSRKNFDPSGYGAYSIEDTTRPFASMNIIKEAQLYCSTVLRDVITRKSLEASHPGIFLEVVYDEFTKTPIEGAEKVYDFAGIQMDDIVKNWLKTKTSQGLDGHNSTQISEKWQGELSYQQTRQIDSRCADLYEEMGFVWPT